MNLNFVNKTSFTHDRRYMFTEDGLIIDGVNSNEGELIYYVTLIEYDLEYENVVYKFMMENTESILYSEEKNNSIGIIEDFDRTLDEQKQNEIVEFIKQKALNAELEGLKENFTLVFKIDERFESEDNRRITIL